MKRISQTELLDLKILELKEQQKSELADLKDQFAYTKNSLSPSSLIKEGFTEVYDTVTSKNKLIGAAVGLFSGYLTKKAIVGKSDSLIKKIIGSVVQFVVPNIINNLNTNNENEKHI